MSITIRGKIDYWLFRHSPTNKSCDPLSTLCSPPKWYRYHHHHHHNNNNNWWHLVGVVVSLITASNARRKEGRKEVRERVVGGPSLYCASELMTQVEGNGSGVSDSGWLRPRNFGLHGHTVTSIPQLFHLSKGKATRCCCCFSGTTYTRSVAQLAIKPCERATTRYWPPLCYFYPLRLSAVSA